MSAFIPIKTFHIGNVVDAFVNADRIVMVWDADYRDDMEGQCFYSMTDGFSTEHAAEPYDSVVAKILAATVKEEKGKIPHTPLKEKGELAEGGNGGYTAPARACEGNLTCEGFLVPTLDEVKAFAATLAIPDDTAEDFWFANDGTGWKYKGNAIFNWRSMLQSWHRARKRKDAQAKSELARMEKRVDEREQKRQAHLDAKMDEREKKRERRSGGRRKADNNVEMSDEVREEVRRDFTF